MQGMGWDGAMRRPHDSGGGRHRGGPRQGARRRRGAASGGAHGGGENPHRGSGAGHGRSAR